jgi:hypothetical protein
MPNTIALSAFVIGLVLVIAALLGAKVKIVQVELPELEGPKRAVMGALGVALVAFGLADGKLPALPGVGAATTSAQAQAQVQAQSADGATVLSCFTDVPAANVHTFMAAPDRRIDRKFPYGKPRDDVIAIQWSDGKAILGGVKFRTMASEVGFDILGVVDGTCNPVQTYRNLDRTDVPKGKPVSYDTLRYDVGGNVFLMDVAYTSDQRLLVRAGQVTP